MSRQRSINPPLNLYKKIALSFIVLTLLLIILIFYFTLSYAFVDVYPKEAEVSTDFNFVVLESPEAVSPAEGIFSGEIINKELSGEKAFTTTGQKQVLGDTVGQVRIFNNLSTDQVLIATTRLLTPDGILFRLKNRVNVPARGSLMAEVYPDDPSQPLAKAGTKFTIPGLSQNLQELVYAETEEDFQASGRFVTAVSQEEMDQALADFSEELALQIFSHIDSAKAKILSRQILETEFSNKPGDEAEEYSLKLTMLVTGVVFDEQPVKFFAENILEGLIPNDKELLATNSDNLIYEIETHNLDNRLAQIKSSIKGVAIISEDSPILAKDKLSTLNFEEIISYLENFEDIEKVEIGFFPSWLKKTPFFQDHIIIRVIK